METNKLLPLAGMNRVAPDIALVHRTDRATHYFVRDAVNGYMTSNGKWMMREAVQRVCTRPLKNLWYSHLHGDTFATLFGQWVKVNPQDWSTEDLCDVGGEASFIVLNGKVLAVNSGGIHVYNGRTAQPLTIATPPAPLVEVDEGALPPGDWAFAVAFLRGDVESAVSEAAPFKVVSGGVRVQLPLPLDPTVTATRLYVSSHQGSEFHAAGDYPNGANFNLPQPPERGAAARFRFRQPMPGGAFPCLWRGRLVVARGRSLHFSEPMTYHLNDPRHGFVQLPQRVTFVVPVDDGLWVGQVDHVVFLRGHALEELSVDFRNTKRPVPGSGVTIDSEMLDDKLDNAGMTCAVWLAENGHVVGTGQGQTFEMQAGVMKEIHANSGQSIFFDRRFLTATL